jgi:hypothetical protein
MPQIVGLTVSRCAPPKFAPVSASTVLHRLPSHAQPFASGGSGVTLFNARLITETREALEQRLVMVPGVGPVGAVAAADLRVPSHSPTKKPFEDLRGG